MGRSNTGLGDMFQEWLTNVNIKIHGTRLCLVPVDETLQA